MELDKSHPIPLYFQLAELLRDQIQSGELNPGDRLPSERELSERHGISRMTVRQALAFLTRDGDLVVRPGVGTFVAEPKLIFDTHNLLGFTEDMLRQGENISSRVLEQALERPPQTVVKGLGLGSSDRAVKIVRLRLINGVPVLLETSHVNASLCPGLEDKSLEQRSLFATFEEDYGLRVEQTRQILEATVANDYEANLFGIDPGVAMILLEGVNYAEDAQALEAFKAVYRGDRFRFIIESRRQGLPDEISGAQKVSVVMD